MQSPAPAPAQADPPPSAPAHGTTRLTLTLTLDGAKKAKATDYALRFIARHAPTQAAAWQLTRSTRRGPVVHVVALTASGPRCDCGAARFQRGPCKHVRALKAHGLLDVNANSGPTGAH
jgi:hypothetical protein